MQNSGEQKKETVRSILGIGPDDIANVSIKISNDCMDHAVLAIQLPEVMTEDDVLTLGEEGALARVGNGLFIIDRPRRYHVVGCVGKNDLTVRFRVSNLDRTAWADLKEKIGAILKASKQERMAN